MKLATTLLERKFFIGFTTAIFMYLIFYFIHRDKIKQQETKAQINKNIEEERSFYNTLKDIANEIPNKLTIDYPTTAGLLLERCNPKHFINSDQSNRTIIATELYSDLLSLHGNINKSIILNIRRRANEELGINLPSDNQFAILESVFNPKNYIDANFDAKRLIACERAHKYIIDNKSDLRKLEQFAYKIGFLEL